ncbi:hypothetical protein SAMN05216203_2470 [Marinobacter daqiaonensis]|uniref:Uncharacterized protein n=1 Tax=Marinobacter daqiaonensis TaxID=650891 RepID=A0A1I6IMA2_9GAMM|nr:hypothetical protein SAMN05216203_2470 [Marinobacter daqiaonensis]
MIVLRNNLMRFGFSVLLVLLLSPFSARLKAAGLFRRWPDRVIDLSIAERHD